MQTNFKALENHGGRETGEGFIADSPHGPILHLARGALPWIAVGFIAATIIWRLPAADSRETPFEIAAADVQGEAASTACTALVLDRAAHVTRAVPCAALAPAAP